MSSKPVRSFKARGTLREDEEGAGAYMFNGGKQTDRTLKLQKSVAVNRRLAGGKRLTFVVEEVCRFVLLGSQQLPVLY